MFRGRESGSLETLRAARIIDCTGSGTDITQSADRLLQALLVNRVARADPLRLGLDVSAEGAVLSGAGIASDRLFAIGPLTKGAVWEITAVPELRSQCRDMACLLAARLVQLGRSHGRKVRPIGGRESRSLHGGRQENTASIVSKMRENKCFLQAPIAPMGRIFQYLWTPCSAIDCLSFDRRRWGSSGRRLVMMPLSLLRGTREGRKEGHGWTDRHSDAPAKRRAAM